VVTAEDGVTRMVARAAQNRFLRCVARAGYPVSGLLHLLVSYIIVRIAVGSSGNADQSGALATVASSRAGAEALWIIAAGLIALAMWRLAETLIGLHPGEHPKRDPDETRMTNRLRAFGLAAVYCAVAYTAVRFALGARKSSSELNAGLSGRLMHSDGGKALLVVIGAAITVIGGYYVYKGASRRFANDLCIRCGRLLTSLGVCGYVAEGLVLCGAGMLVMVASLRSEPAKAAGIDAAVKMLGHAPFGKAVLIAAAVGFAAYGLYSCALTRYSRM